MKAEGGERCLRPWGLHMTPRWDVLPCPDALGAGGARPEGTHRGAVVDPRRVRAGERGASTG